MDAAASQIRLSETIHRATLRVLRALARVLLRHGVAFQAFSALAKQAYVDVAREDFALPRRKPSTSRIALLTGLTRKEVQRQSEGAGPADRDAADGHNRAARVVAGWVRDPDFRSSDGEPRVLPFDGTDGFSELVRRHSGDVTPRAVLDELLRVGTVECDEAGNIRLLTRVYIPRRSDLAKLAILGADVSFLIDTIDHNLQDPEHPRFQRKVMYDNLPAEAIEQLRPLVDRHAQELIETLDAWMARHDRDANPSARGSGRLRAGLGVFYFEQDLDRSHREN